MNHGGKSVVVVQETENYCLVYLVGDKNKNLFSIKKPDNKDVK